MLAMHSIYMGIIFDVIIMPCVGYSYNTQTIIKIAEQVYFTTSRPAPQRQ